jgi:hypothetical protein
MIMPIVGKEIFFNGDYSSGEYGIGEVPGCNQA